MTALRNPAAIGRAGLHIVLGMLIETFAGSAQATHAFSGATDGGSLRLLWVVAMAAAILATVAILAKSHMPRPATASNESPTVSQAQVQPKTPTLARSLALGDYYDGDWTLAHVRNPKLPERNKTGEAFIRQMLVDAMRDAPQCAGIRLVVGDKAKDADFRVTGQRETKYPTATGPEERWIWFLAHGEETGGMDFQDTVQEAAAGICTTVWEDVDPHHYKKPGATYDPARHPTDHLF